MGNFPRTEEYLSRRRDSLDEMAGKRGVTAAREQYTKLSAVHADHARNVVGAERAPRDAGHIRATRQQIERLTDPPARGIYGQITGIPATIPARLRTHPDLRERVRLVDNLARARALLPAERQEWDSKRRGEGLSLDLYAYAHNGRVSIWQVRETERRTSRGYLNIKKTYYIVRTSDDGETAIEPLKPHKIKRAATADPSPDSPIRALAGELKLPHNVETWTAYKLVGMHPTSGDCMSIYDQETRYVFGRRMMQAARDDHGGGYYVSRTPEAARRHGEEIARIVGCTWPLRLIECECVGRGIAYGNKIAVGILTPKRFVCE